MKRNLLSAALLAAGLFMGGHAFALEQDEAGVYQIGTAQDLVDFATLVNDKTDDADNSAACAVLTADIDLADVTWTPIGNGDRRYKGTFDGQFHAIKNMTLQNVKEQGLFGVCENATIKYVTIDKSCTLRTVGDTPCTTALVGCCNGKGTLTIIGCTNYADIVGSKANNSAFVGCNYSSGNLKVEIIYCANYGNISGGWENGVFCGWFAGACKVYGSVNFGKISDQQGDLTLGRGHGSLADYVNSYDFNEENNCTNDFRYADYSEEIAKSGALCFVLNSYPEFNGWFQNLGEDNFPTLDPTHKAVYATGENYCDGTPKAAYTYTNEEGATVVTDPHEFVDGYCKNCGTPDPDYLTKDADGFYLIGTAKEFQWFANYAKTDGTISCKLTADLDFAGITNYEPVGYKGEYFCGTLDGQFHKIKNLIINKGEASDNFVGLIGTITDGAVICNLTIDSSCSIIGYSYVGAFAGGSQGSGKAYFYSLGNEADVATSDPVNGGKNVAGIIGVSNGSGCGFIIRNCYNTGNITGGNESAAITGWFGGGSEIYGCYNTGDIIGAQGENSMWRGGCTYYHVWDLNKDNLRLAINVMEDFDESMWASGEFCYNLNCDQENIGWYQNLGTDPKPVLDPTHAKVFPVGALNCDGSAKGTLTYSNTDGQYTRDDHEYDNGFCIHCGKTDPASTLEKDEEGFYHITNGGEFAIFTSISSGDPTVSCKLEADIDMDGLVCAPIGGTNVFTGTVDGQMHKISNLVISDPSNDYQALVGKVGGGFILRNLIVDETCSIEGKAYSAGLVGGSSGEGDILIENCGNEATVTGTGANIAGIIGVNMGSAAHFIIKNVYNTGIITGGNESAAISGWLGGNAELTGVWNSGSATGIQDGKPLYRDGGAPTCTNCFSIEGIAQDGFSSFTIDDLESGALAYFLNGQVSGGTAWTQTLDEDYWPVPFSNHGIIYTAGTFLCDGSIDPDSDFGYSNEEGTVIKPDHEWEDGVCVNCGDADPTWKEADEDGWYSISNEKEFAWFGGMVKIGNTDIKGRLTDDIDLSGVEWRPIGTEKNPFKGIFDGQCHYIDGLDVYGENYVGLFGVVTGGAEFKNFIVSGSVTGNAFCAGIAGGSNGTGVVKFTNVGNECSVNGSAQNAAGIIGVSMSGGCAFIMNNCYNAGDITGARETAAFSGWMGKAESEINNCYNIGTISGYDEGNPLYRCACQIKDLISINEDSQQGIVLGTDAVTSGELAFYVNGMEAEGTHFFQTLGEDDYPVPFKEGHETVYAHGKLLCDGTVDPDGLSFANEPGEFEKAEHQFGEDGCCELCGNAWGISTAEQLLQFSWNVQAYITNEAEAYLLNDIDLKDVEWEPIGYGGTTSSGTDDCIPYGGKFDGQGHKIYNMVIDDGSRMFLGFFGCLTGGAEVKNLIIDKSCYVHGDAYCAGFAGGSKLSGNILFENCGNECDVLCDGSNGANAAGFVGCNMNSSATFLIKNCFNTGNIKGVLESASFSGWLGSNARVINSWNTGSIEGIQDGKPFARMGSATFTNCYDLAGTQTNINRLTASAVSSGELCYYLNEGNTEDPIWRQTIGVDPYPAFYPESKIVYLVGYEYTNDPDGTGIQPIISNDPDATVSSVFTLQGVRTDEMQRGINIVRMSDGTVRKVLVK